jgi:hypothetical protein
VVAPEERKQRAWEGMRTSFVIGRAGMARRPRGTSGVRRRLKRCFDVSGGEINDEDLRGSDMTRVKLLRFVLIQYIVVMWTLCMCR